MNIIDVSLNNVAETGFFCMMSKRKAVGYQRKMQWVSERFAEGMRIKMLDLSEGGRGFIEYIPGRHAWRPVEADGYMFIHCLWVVGRSREKGFGGLLLNECIEDAKKLGMKGVAMIASERPWLADTGFLQRHGFESVAEAPPALELMVKRFGRARPPSFTGNWDEKLRNCGRGLTIFRSDQCPYLEDATKILVEAAKERRLHPKIIELENRRSVRELSPSAYGVFNIVYDGRLLSYHYLTRKEFLKRIDEAQR